MRRRKAEQKKQSRERKRQKRLLELERKREGNKTMISYRDQQVVNMEEERETPSIEMTSPTWNAPPTFQVGEVISVEGDFFLHVLRF